MEFVVEGKDYERLNDNKVSLTGQIAMIGAGTGLGHGYLAKHENGKYYHVYPSEGGHADFCPHDDLQWRYFKYLQSYYNVSHVSIERACAGPALVAMYSFFVENEKLSFDNEEILEIKTLTPEVILEQALNGKSKICERVIELFVELYAHAAGNLANLVLPTGGLYLLGGLSVALEKYILHTDTFRKNFVDKGRLKPFLEKIPIFIVKNPFMGVKGAEEYCRRLLERHFENEKSY